MDKLIKDVQLFYAEQMENHGFGRKTFVFEADAQGKAVVHHIKGKFDDAYYRKLPWDAWIEIHEQFDRSKNIYLTAIDVSSEGFPGACGLASRHALIPASGGCFNVVVTAHELGHTFGLRHDNVRSDGNWIPALGIHDPMITSFCAAEWLEVHPAFNAGGTRANRNTKIEMRPPNLISPPNTIRLRFVVTDPDGLHQAQLLMAGGLSSCKQLNGNLNHTVEFVTTNVTPKIKYVGLWVTDVYGNHTAKSFSLDITPLLPRPKVVSIPDENLAAVVRQQITNITTHTMLNITQLNVPNREGVTNLAGLELAHNLKELYIRGEYINREGNVNNAITDVSPLAGLRQLTHLYLSSNAITDVSPLKGLKQLRHLDLTTNRIVDVSPLAGLRQLTVLYLANNDISDVSPLVELNLKGRQWNSTGLYLEGNPLNYASINTHIPAMQAKGIEVKFDNRTPTTLVKISGTAQQGIADAALLRPFVVEVRDQENRVFAGVPITFAVTTGGGRLSATNTTTDVAGRAKTYLTLGGTVGTTTVRVTAPNISNPVQFTATVIPLGSFVVLPDANLRTKITETLGKKSGEAITVADMITLTALTANNANIRDLTGLQYANNLTTLLLDNNNISDVALLEAFTQLETLSLDNNDIWNVEPLVALTQLKTLHLRGNSLSYPSLHTSIPAIQARGTTVAATPRTPTTLVKISRTQGVAGAALSLIIEVQDEKGFRFSGVPVTFTVTAGGGKLSASNVITDTTGKARTTLTLGTTPGKNTVRATAVKAPRSVSFTVTAIDPNSPIDLPDANLLAKIVDTLGKPRGAQLTAGNMLALRRFDARNANIQDLTGLENAHNLSDLNLGGEYVSGKGYVNSNKVADFSLLLKLPRLTKLNLFFSSLSDISFLAKLTQLTSLTLGYNDISDVSALTALTQLKTLSLWRNDITDVTPLASLTQLTTLGLSSNSIVDISALARLTQLTTLDISSNDISDVTPLVGLARMAWLYLNNNDISDIAPLAGFTQLRQLQLRGNSISDAAPLAGLTQLTQLNLISNDISDVSPLVDLNLTGTSRDSTGLYIQDNPLSYASINTHIPAMEAKGIGVKFDNRAYRALLKISGDRQRGLAGKPLTSPLVLEVQDEHGQPMPDVDVTFAIDAGDGVLTPTNTTADADGKARTTLTLGWTPGTSTIRATAARIPSSVRFTATATTLPNRIAEDVNGDGRVDVEDLVLVAASFGAVPIPSVLPDTDVNNDGEVNEEDVALVLAALEAGTAAPSAVTKPSAVWTAERLQWWITEAKYQNVGNETFQRGIAVLKQLLNHLLPKETALLPNYPNPFNPETWIPYQLATSSDVTLRIYAVNGALVRTLALGHQPAGMYHNRSRAAHWDGRNEQGESVASGVYFYTLSVGDFTATRKMLIQK